jgi:hypothetical protein
MSTIERCARAFFKAMNTRDFTDSESHFASFKDTSFTEKA